MYQSSQNADKLFFALLPGAVSSQRDDSNGSVVQLPMFQGRQPHSSSGETERIQRDKYSRCCEATKDVETRRNRETRIEDVLI